jgi:predicted enzyme related to lactoylglutathione lyase
VTVQYIKFVTFDCVDPVACAFFWSQLLGSNLDEDSTPEKAFVEAPGWGGPGMWFNRTDTPKTERNRLHFDLRATDTMAAEVERAVRLGATVVGGGDDITRLLDPEGNEFCIEPGPGDDPGPAGLS